jgi:membrane protein
VQSLRDVLIWWQRLSLNYQRNRVALAAGGLAYFVALSVAPAALAFGTMAGLVLDPAQVRDALERLAERTPGTVDAFRPMLESLLSTIETASASTFTITALISVFVAIYGASKVVFGLRMAMNTIFGVIETRSGLIDRAISAVVTLVGLVVAVGLVVVAAVLPSVLAELGVDRPSLLTGSPWVEWLVIAILVYLAARWLLAHAPDHSRRVPWASRGALVATVGILVVTAGVGVYARLSTSLNAAVLVFGTAVVVLLWLYLCFVSLLWGAIIEADDQRVRGDAPTTGTSTAEDRPPGR